MNLYRKKLNIGRALRNKKLLYTDVDTSNLDVIIYTIHIDDNELFWSATKLDSIQLELIQSEIYQNSTDKDNLLLAMIENISESSENITNHPNLKNFLQEKNILHIVRNYKLKKILN